VETPIQNKCTLYILTRSGIYRAGNTPELTDKLNKLQIIVIHKKDKDDEIMIPVVTIEYIYLNSIYPNIKQIKQRIKKISSGIIGNRDKEGVLLIVPLSVFKRAMEIYDISLSELFEYIKEIDKSGENTNGGVIYNLTCRSPCNNEEELKTQLTSEIRRRKSITALNTFMDDDNDII
jgi:hypothetical protein